jgi:hypothetical protein
VGQGRQSHQIRFSRRQPLQLIRRKGSGLHITAPIARQTRLPYSAVERRSREKDENCHVQTCPPFCVYKNDRARPTDRHTRHGAPTSTGTNYQNHDQLLMTQRIGTQSDGFPQTWLGRVVGGLLAATLLVSAFFFLFLFLLVLGVLILAVLLRLLWKAKEVRAQASQEILEGEYSVAPQEEGMPDGSAADITHKH